MFAVPVAASLAAMLVTVACGRSDPGFDHGRGQPACRGRDHPLLFQGRPRWPLEPGRIDDGLKALIETGLFQDVRINNVGGRLVVTVVENPVIGRIAFEGNKKVKDDQLSAEIQSKPRGTLSRPMVQSDAQRIAEIYRRSGR